MAGSTPPVLIENDGFAYRAVVDKMAEAVQASAARPGAVPDAKWLAMEAPTPPLDKILTKFLPQLPKKFNFKGGPAIPPPLLKHGREAMEARNTLAHKGEFDWNDEKLEAVLSSFNDLLLMFDVYAGQKWASELVSYETLKLLR